MYSETCQISKMEHFVKKINFGRFVNYNFYVFSYVSSALEDLVDQKVVELSWINPFMYNVEKWLNIL